MTRTEIEKLEKFFQRRFKMPVIEVRRRGWYNPSLEYRQYMVPGILVHLRTEHASFGCGAGR